MKRTKLWLLLPVLLSAWLAPASAQRVPERESLAYDLLSDLVPAQTEALFVSTPSFSEAAPARYENPPCVPHAALQPGRAFAPAVSDARRERAIEDLLSKIAVCAHMPYNNDGNVHSKPHPGLPARPAGYYLEYTLIVPGRNTGAGPEPVLIGGTTYMAGPVLSPRGPERLMIGGGREVYYTPDHYTTFIRLDIVR